MNIEEIDREACQFKFRGKNIAYLSQRNMRNLAKHLSVDSEGTKLQVFNKIVSYLEESGAKAVISDATDAEDIKATPEPEQQKRPAKKVARKRTPRRKATFL